MKLQKRLILKKESFGGIFVDTYTGEQTFLRHEEYESKKNELSQLKDKIAKVQIIDVTEMGYPLLTNAISSPCSMFWELTKSCNGACTNCFMDANSPKLNQAEVSFLEIKDIIRQFADLGGYSIRLTGGEPTLRQDFFDIVDLLNETGMITGLNTNGMFNEKTLEQILLKGIKDIRISLDGPEDVNDRVRWPGNYKGAIATVERIAEYNKTALEPTTPTINVVLMKSTMPYIKHMIKLANNYGFKISFGLMRLSGRANSEEMLSPEDVAQASHTAQCMRDELGLAHGTVRINYDIFCESTQDGKGMIVSGYSPYPFDNSKCPLGACGLNLDAYARVVTCGYFTDVEKMTGEDIRGNDMLQVWHQSKLLQSIRGVTRNSCTGCDYYKTKCNGGCPAMAYFLYGNIKGKDPYCIKDIDIESLQKQNKQGI